jgi:ribosomal-protein-alanine N-acetyltransferase
MKERAVEIRPMKAGDIDGVLAIEESVFPTPWPRECFEREIESGGMGLSWVALSDGAVVGYIVSWAVADELHIGNLAVTPRLRCFGTGTELVRRSLAAAVEHGIGFATLEVRASNEGATRLYERLGFRPVAMIRGYYPDNGEDAVVMMTALVRERGG